MKKEEKSYCLCKKFLDEIAPLDNASWNEISQFKLKIMM